jgi:RHS repeat-associated protein
MPIAPRETVLCHYRYDPLDRLVDCAPSAEAGIQRFYCKSRLATEIQGAVQRSVFQHDNQLLAQLRREDVKVDTTLLATDQQRSVLNVLDTNRLHPLAYTPYGYRPAENGLLSLLGFNGERPDPVTGHYVLGNGYRVFNPVLMRFNSPDSSSPIGKGGMNAYTYCVGDPVNRKDPTGHSPVSRLVKEAQKLITITITEETDDFLKKLATSKLSKLERVRRTQKAIQNQSILIKKNEAKLANQTSYTKTKNIPDILTSYDAYEQAKKQYGFSKYPATNIPFWVPDSYGNPILNTYHFDVTIDHYTHLSSKNQLKTLKAIKNIDIKQKMLYIAKRMERERAEYIRNFTGIDLLAPEPTTSRLP